MKSLSSITWEDLFPEDKTRPKSEQVAPRFKRVYSLSPLEYIVRLEEQEDLHRNGIRLEILCREYLRLHEYGFLVEILGHNFGSHLRMPYEFKDFTEDELGDYFRANIGTFRHRLGVLMKNVENNGHYGRKEVSVGLISSPYAFATKDEIIEIYEAHKKGNVKYPPGFFNPMNRRLARILTQHLVDDILKLPLNKLIPDVKRKTFDDHRLGTLLDVYYDGSQMNAITDAYPEHKFPEVYKPDYKPDNTVKLLLSKLDAF